MKKLFVLIALFSFSAFGQAAVTVAKTVHDTAQVLRTRIADTSAVLRTFTKQTAQDTATKVSHDTSLTIRAASLVSIHDSLAVRVPQSIDTSATPLFHSVSIRLNQTANPCGDSATVAIWFRVKGIAAGDTAWVAGCK